MKKMLTLLAVSFAIAAASSQEIPTARFGDAINHFRMTHEKGSYARYDPGQFREIADNIVAYQNEDGGWPKNIDMLAKLDPDSVKQALKPFRRASTLDNSNIYTQAEYLSNVWVLTQDTTYSGSARRAFEYILSAQYPNGGWRGWDVDAVTFNDGVMEGVMDTWLDVLEGNPIYAWVDDGLRARIRKSFDRAVGTVLACQYVRNGVKTAWPQQSDHETLQPCQARSYEFPSLSASESAGIVMLLMRIRHPSPEVVEAVKTAATWFDGSKITGKKIVTVSVPEGLAENPKIKKDRMLVDDPEASPIWARFYELDTNRPFMSTREGKIVYDLCEVPAERRTGYAWYGGWGNKVLRKYPVWLRRIEKEQAANANDKAVQTLREFYTAYIRAVSEGDSHATVQQLVKKYCTARLLARIEKSGLDYDPFLNAQDADPDWVSSLCVEKGDAKNTYLVSYWYPYAKKRVYIGVSAEKDGDSYKIVAVDPVD